MKEKLFIFKGANLSHTSQSSLTNKMANYEDTYVIGNHEDGFCHTDISNVMTPQLTGEETLINVLVDRSEERRVGKEC